MVLGPDGSQPAGRAVAHSCVAQLAERPAVNWVVIGSSPFAGAGSGTDHAERLPVGAHVAPT